METLWQDVKYGARTLVKSPAFAAAAILSLGLGIGANTTIFTLLNTIFLNPLAVERPAELVAVYTVDERNSGPFGNLRQVSFPNYRDYRDKNEVFTGLAAYSFPLPLSLSLGGEPEQVFAELVTGNYFELLGVRPALGRFFRPEEDRTPATHPVVVMGHGLWQRRFGGDQKALGRTITLNGTSYTVVGIAPEGFKGVNSLFGPDVWVPTMMHAQALPAQLRDWFESRRALAFSLAGRLRPGVAVDAAEAHMKTLARALEREYPEPNKGRTVTLRPLAEATVFPGVREALLMGTSVLMVIVGLVLLIACSNVANLLLARANARRSEIAVRLALGAGRARLVRQLLTESALLALVGGAFGLALAYWARGALWSFRPPFLAQNFVEIQLDGRVLLFTVGVSLVTGLIFGLAPAFQASRPDVVGALKEETRSAGRSRRGLGLGNALVVGQVALSLLALIAASLFLRSIGAAYAIDPGFETETLAVFTASPAQRGYARARGEQYYRDVTARIAGLPGVRSVSWSTNLPLFGGIARSIFIEGRETSAEASAILTLFNTIDVKYFETMGIPLLRGRDFTDADREGSVRVAIINETMAQKYWPRQDAVGKRFRFYTDNFFHEVVGVVRTAKYITLGETPQACVYAPLRQNYSDTMVLYVRSQGDPASMISTVRAELRAIDSQMPVTNTWTIAEVLDQSLWAAKLGAGLLGVFGALALALASVGLYGVMAYSVSRRQREIGLRMALGAEQGRVLALVLRQGMTLVVLGVVLGLAAAFAVSRAVASLLFGISATDPASFAGASAVLLAVALVASYVPARRASRVDPLTALREL